MDPAPEQVHNPFESLQYYTVGQVSIILIGVSKHTPLPHNSPYTIIPVLQIIYLSKHPQWLTWITWQVGD